jgi:hypothetical protein
MSVVQVIIDRTTSMVIEGVYEFDRGEGGTLIAPAGTSFPVSPEPGEWFWRSDQDNLYRRNDANTAWIPLQVSVGTDFEFLLENDPPLGSTASWTVVAGKITKETWTLTATSLTLKTTDYTYTGNKVTTEVRKVFAADGVTVGAQETITYTYVGNSVNTETRVRNV